MKTPDTAKLDDNILSTLAGLFTVVNNHVLSEKSPTAFALLWIVPEDRFTRRWSLWLHRRFSSPDIDWAYKALIAISLTLLLWFVNIEGKWSLVIVCLASLVLSVPVWWTYYELTICDVKSDDPREPPIDKRLPWGLRALTRFLMLFLPSFAICLLVYLVLNAPSPNLLPDVRLIVEARGIFTYQVLAVALSYFSAISFYVYLLMRLFSIGAFYVLAMVQWILRYHTPERTDYLEKLLNKPLDLLEDGNKTRILDLDSPYIDALHEWAMLRRQVIQDKLIPTTLLLALLGILANTSLGEEVLGWFAMAFRGNLDAGAVITRLVVLGLAIVLPARAIAILLSEAYSTGVIAQACVLVRRSRILTLDS